MLLLARHQTGVLCQVGRLILFVYFITKSFLTHSFFSTYTCFIKSLSRYMCSMAPVTAKVGSRNNHMRGPGIGCWFSDRSNCSHWSFEAAVLPLTFTLTSENLSLYTTLLHLMVLIQLCSPRCWHLNSSYCRTRCKQPRLRFVLLPLLLHLRLMFQSDIPLFTLTS